MSNNRVIIISRVFTSLSDPEISTLNNGETFITLDDTIQYYKHIVTGEILPLGQKLTASATAPTAPTPNSGTQIANLDYVRAWARKFIGTGIGVSANTTLTAAQVGNWINVTGASGITLTLPSSDSVSPGQNFVIRNASAGTVTIATQGGNINHTSTTATLVLTRFETIEITANSVVNGGWFITDRSRIEESAPLASPTFTGDPKAPTPLPGDNDNSLATTAFVQAALNGKITTSVAGSGSITLTAAQYSASILIFTGALTGNKTVVLPTISGQWQIVNSTTGAFTLTVKTAAGTGVLVTQGTTSNVYCDAVNIGLQQTDFISPVMTGNPTAPTPDLNDNDTSVATTAFVQNALNAAGINSSTLAAIANLDDFTVTNGWYAVNSTTTGTKPSGQTWGVVVINGRIFTSAETRVAQVYYYTDGTIFRSWGRNCFNGVWGAWQEIALLDSPTFVGTPKVPTAALSTTGTQAASLDFVRSWARKFTSAGIGVSTTPYTIPASNTGSWINITAANAVITLPAPSSLVSGETLLIRNNSGTNITISAGVGNTIAGISAATTIITMAPTEVMEFAQNSATSYWVVNRSKLVEVAEVNSPSLTGIPTAPTPQPGTTGNQIATVDFVNNAVNGSVTVSIAGNGSTTLNTAQYSAAIITFTGVLTGNKTVIFPVISSQWQVVNNTSGNFTVTVKTSTGTGVLVTQGTSSNIYSNGANIGLQQTDFISPVMTGNPTAPTPIVNDNSKSVATTEFIKRAIDNLVAAAPGTLDTLNEIAKSLGDDPNFATTMTNALALKAPLASPPLTGTPTAPNPANNDISNIIATTAYVRSLLKDYGFATTSFNGISDIDDFTLTNGWYVVSSTTVGNKPSGQVWGVLAVNGRAFAASGTRTTQTFYLTDGLIFRTWGRNCFNGTWGAWQEMAMLDSPTFTGDPKAPTPATGDNDTSIATTAFVQNTFNANARKYLSNVVGISTNTTLTVAQTGLAFNIAAAGVTVTLPAAASAGSGQTYVIRNGQNSNATITASTGLIYTSYSGNSATLVLAPYEWVELQATTTNYFVNMRGKLGEVATIDSPTFTGDPKAPTPAATDSDNSIATTAFVRAAMGLFGVGVDNGPDVADCNTTTTSGIYRCQGSTTANSPIATNATLIVASFNSTGTMQLFTSLAGSTGYPRVFTRSQAGGSWSAWKEIAITDSPSFTGNATAPTTMIADNSTRIATTAFVYSLLADYGIASTLSKFISDLDSLRGTRFFGHAGTATGAPVTAGAYDAVGLQIESNGQRTQFSNPGNRDLYMRVDDAGVNGAFGDWFKIAFEESPSFTGSPTAPTRGLNDNSSNIATTAFVNGLINSYGLGNRTILSNPITNIDDPTLAPGWYAISQNATTTGTKPTGWGLLQVNARQAVAGNGGRIVQTFYGTDNIPSIIWNRSYLYQNSTWGPWYKSYDESNLPITSSELDTTTNAILKVGDFGLGSKAVQMGTGNIDDILISADYYITTTNVLGTLPAGKTSFQYMVIRHLQADGGSSASQELIDRNTNRFYLRGKASGNWKPWVEIWTEGNLVKTTSPYDNTADRIMKVGDFGLGTTDLVDLTNNTDLNTIFITGFYQVGNSSLNAPPNNGSGQMIVMTNAQRWTTQIFYPQSSNRAYFRTSNNGVFIDWIEFWTSANLTKTASATDTTSGRMVQAGDYGWGLAGNAVNTIAANVDLNTITTTGSYGNPLNANAKDTLNYPVAKAGSLLVQSGGNSITTQVYIEYNTGRIWSRSLYNSTWFPWNRIIDSNTSGTVVTSDITVNNLDSTLNRVMKVGDFGLGITGGIKLTFTSNEDWAKPQGWSGFIDITATKGKGVTVPVIMGTSTTPTYGNWCITGRRDSLGGYTGIFTDYGTGRVWIGHAANSADTPTFREMYSSLNISAFMQSILDDSSALEMQNTMSLNNLYVKNVTGGTVTLTDAEVANKVLWFSGNLTSNVIIIVPTVNNWTVFNRTSGNYTFTIKTANVTGLTIEQGSQANIVSGGSGALYFANSQVFDLFAGGEISTKSTVGNSYRLINPANTYGVFQRVDTTRWYMMVTDLNNPNGSWNGLRPMSFDLATGKMSFASGASSTTQAIDNNSTDIATTAYVQNVLNSVGVNNNNINYISNINDYSLTNGWYAIGNTTAGTKPSGQTYGLICVNSRNTSAGATRVNQIFYYTESGGITRQWSRNCFNAVWTDWQEFAYLDSPVFTGSPRAPSPANLNSAGNGIANLDYVRGWAQKYQGAGIGISATPYTLTSAHTGNWINITGTNAVITLPSPASIQNGEVVKIRNGTAGNITIAPGSGNSIVGAPGTNLIMSPREVVEFACNSNTSYWIINRAKYVEIAEIDSPSFTGNATAPTPSSLDSSNRIATTEFVSKNGISFDAPVSVAANTSASVTLTADMANKIISVSGTTGNFRSLILPEGVAVGSTFTFIPTTSSSTVRISSPSGGSIKIGGASWSAITANGDEAPVTVVHMGSNNYQVLTGAVGQYGTFAMSSAVAGYQKLPSGMIFQWCPGGSDSNSMATFTLPIAFPNNIIHGIITEGNPVGWSDTNASIWSYQSGGKTSAYGYVRYADGGTVRKPGAGVAARLFCWGY